VKQDCIEERRMRAQQRVEQLTPMLKRVNTPAKDIVRINAGGTLVLTSTHTLTRFPDSRLAAMFSGSYELARDSDQCVFIDRDGESFTALIKWLRSNCNGALLTDDVQREAQYWEVPLELGKSCLAKVSQATVLQYLAMAVGTNGRLVLTGCDLRGIHFGGVDFKSGPNFCGCDLSNANFSSAKLYDANFTGCKLFNTNFEGASFDLEDTCYGHVQFNQAQLSGIKFTTSMPSASFREAILDMVEFTKLSFGSVSFSESSLSNCTFNCITRMSRGPCDNRCHPCKFDNATLHDVQFIDCEGEKLASEANRSGIYCASSGISGARVKGWSFTKGCVYCRCKRYTRTTNQDKCTCRHSKNCHKEPEKD